MGGAHETISCPSPADTAATLVGGAKGAAGKRVTRLSDQLITIYGYKYSIYLLAESGRLMKAHLDHSRGLQS